MGQYRRRTTVTQEDARDFIRNMSSYGRNVLLYVDPPYLVQGNGLYLNSMKQKDHAELATLLKQCEFPWLLTYDADEQVTGDLYRDLRIVEFDIAHTAQVQHVGSEYAVFGPHLVVPSLDVLGSTNARWVVA